MTARLESPNVEPDVCGTTPKTGSSELPAHVAAWIRDRAAAHWRLADAWSALLELLDEPVTGAPR